MYPPPSAAALAAQNCRVGIVVAPGASATLSRAAVFAAAELTVAGIDTTSLTSSTPAGEYDGFVWATPAGAGGQPPNTVTIHEQGVAATHLDVSYAIADVGRVAAEHLLRYQRSRLAIVRGPAVQGGEDDIARGFHAVAPSSVVLDLPDWHRAITDGRRFDGVLALSAAGASAVLQLLHRRRSTVPAEVAVIGFDHHGLERLDVGLSLTTVNLPSRRMGSTAARMLIAALAGRRVGTTARTVSPTITARKSAPRAPRPHRAPHPAPRSEALIS